MTMEKTRPRSIEEETNTRLLLEILREAGEIGMKYWRKNIPAEVKESHYAIVTEADKEIEAFLTEQLTRHYPDHDILAEESPKSVSEPFFVIDPLDGTSFFHRGLTDWSVTFARVDGGVQFGATYNPVLDELYYANLGNGAYLNGQPIHVSSSSISEAIVGVGHGALYSDDGRIRDLLKDIRVNWSAGSSAYVLANLAAGRIDAFIHQNQAFWDIAAGTILIREAGGKFTNWEGSQKFDMTGARTSQNNVLATNGYLHDSFITYLNPNKFP